MTVLRLHHAQITIPQGADAEAAARLFYVELLGLSIIPKPESLAGRGGFWVQVGDQQLHIGSEDGVDRLATKAHLAYLVDDLAAWQTHLTGAGFALLDNAPIPGYERFEIRDPFGNRVEFIAYAPSEPPAADAAADWDALFTTFPVLTTPRLTLRAASAEDAGGVLAYMNDPQLWTYLGGTPMTTLDEAHGRIATFERSYRERSGLPWLLVERTSGTIIGGVSLWNLVRDERRGEIGYMLGSAWWGRGYMREALAAVLTLAFETMGLHRVEAWTDVRNLASRRLLERLGFVQEAVLSDYLYDQTRGRWGHMAVFARVQPRRSSASA